LLKSLLVKLFILFFLTKVASSSLYTLENGLNIILEEVPTSEFVAIYAFVKAGSIYEEKYMGSGISHFVEHMLFKGTKKRRPGEIAREIEKEGGRINASTSFDKTIYKIVIPKDALYIAVDILKDCLFFPSFPEDELIKEKKVILREIETRDDEGEIFLSRALFHTAFTTHPLRHPIIGYKELFEKLTREDLITYHKKMYIPENITVVCVGNFDEEEVFSKIKRVFSTIPREGNPPIILPNEPRQMVERRFYEKRPLGLAYLNIGFHIPDISHPDVYALDILSIILGSGRMSRLNKALKDEKGLVFSIDTWSFTPSFPGLFGISANLPEKNIQETEKQIIHEIEKIKKDGVSKNECIAAQRKIVSSLFEEKETIEKKAYSLGSNFLATGNPYFSDHYIENIKLVTPSKIRDVAKTYLKKENMTICVLAPEDAEKKKEKVVVEKSKIKKYTLPNNLIVLINPSHTKGLVSIHAVLKGGRLVEREGKEGISNLVASLLLCGTKNKSKEEIIREIEFLGGSISNYSGRNSFGISMKLLPQDLDKGLEILSSILREPGFPQDEIEREKRNVILSIKAREDNLFLLSQDTFLSTLYTIHPYRIPEVGTEESIKAISRGDILTFYQDRIMPNNTVLAIFGDVDLKKAEKSIKKHFLPWKKEVYYKPRPYVEPPIEKQRETRKKSEKFASLSYTFGFPGARISDEERYTFELISAILSRQGGRLFNALRETEGLVYYVDSFNVFGLDPGYFVVYCQTSKKSFDIVSDKIRQEIKRLYSEEISLDELDEAKAYLIGEKEKRLEDSASYGFEAALYELYGLGYEELGKYKEKIIKMTPSIIKETAKKYFSPEKQVSVIISP